MFGVLVRARARHPPSSFACLLHCCTTLYGLSCYRTCVVVAHSSCPPVPSCTLLCPPSCTVPCHPLTPSPLLTPCLQCPTRLRTPTRLPARPSTSGSLTRPRRVPPCHPSYKKGAFMPPFRSPYSPDAALMPSNLLPSCYPPYDPHASLIHPSCCSHTTLAQL